ncbi:helix-turn-helix domain-containing protein [Chamaesiphon sp. VAR_48_metabat_403]|uniref:helix-turn-helix domain-containing protein n=1 Tax=Chamaesiphon sp. VAR_48_metabat_403 TaxID=2964700 RepID=UPI00286DD006|nr:helix-turn-helix domain-containing protein [Chamaesiphon sp. VAR_48_metabat_403]
MVLTTSYHFSAPPTVEDTQLSALSSHLLAQSLQTAGSSHHIKVVDRDGSEQNVVIPALAINLLVEILTQISQGNTVSIMPVQAELTTQEAANLLNISRPHLIKLIDRGDLPCRKVGKHRRILSTDLVVYKQQKYRLRAAALDELAALSQELDMGY